MISSLTEPFCFGDLKGTSWYHRFVAEEFYIFLDHYPERKIIEDSLVTSEGLYPRKLTEKYQDLILSYFLDNEENPGRSRDSKTPLQVLLDLREIRKKLIPEFDYNGKKELSGINLSEVSGFSHSYNDRLSPVRDLLKLYPGYKASLTPSLEDGLKHSRRILFVPGSVANLEGELSVLRRMTPGVIEILPVDDPMMPGITKGQLKQLLFSGKDSDNRLKDSKICIGHECSLSPTDDLLKRLLNNISTEHDLLFTTNIWFYLSVFRRVEKIGFFLTNKEWFSRGLFQKSWEKPDDHLSGMRPGSYKNIVKSVTPHCGVLLAGMQTSFFPREVNITGTGYSSLGLSDFLEGKAPESLDSRIREQGQVLGENIPGLQFSNRRCVIDSNNVVRMAEPEEECVLVTSLIFPEKSAALEPLLHGSGLPPEGPDLHGQGFLCPFNYYFTSNLVRLHNACASPEEGLKFENFFIDYLGKRTDTGWNETIPLYNKAFLGCTLTGTLFAGHFPLEGAGIILDGKEIFIPLSEINPKYQSEKTSLYLPSFSEDQVGENRKCLVLVQDQMVYYGSGPCRIPPAGTVIVLEHPHNKKPVSIQWKPVLGKLPFPIEELAWLVGGFNLLSGDGENYYPNPAGGRESLCEEGWNTPGSGRTQETQLDPAVRQPRVVLGKTRRGNLVLSLFSGRTDVSYGATFSETVAHTMDLLPTGEDLDFLINLDGGASASVTYYKDDFRMSTGLTAPSFTNPTGVPRRLPGYLSIKINTTSGAKIC